jgi:hypothetical protein|tara:strand:+ start:77 stop:280 length:204 start_codon:yes stop_codon:yes gene_type:complete
MAKFRVMVRETYVMTYEADTPAQAGEKAMECMNEHPDQHILMQEMQFVPIEDDEKEWAEIPISTKMH